MSFLEIRSHITYLSHMERIGEGLVRLGKLESDQVEEIVGKQGNGDNRLFGEIAVDLDFIHVEDLIYHLTQQSELDVV
ncbi:MAG TPA: hypothetical protein VMW69_03235 [Spirochaetia bacterium]|nr:hypothetical protein [Spirochaetia bacterium]